VFPLRADPEEEASTQRCDQAWEKVFSNGNDAVLVPADELDTADTLEEQIEDVADVERPEVDDVIGRIIDESGAFAYEITWKGFSRDDTTWHYAPDLSGCQRLVDEFEARIAERGESDEREVYAAREDDFAPGAMAAIFGHEQMGRSADESNSTQASQSTPNRERDEVYTVDSVPPYMMAVTEIEVQDFLLTEGGRAAVNKEWDAMTVPGHGMERARLVETRN
jgi:hypothetical protein